jgi:hypothetical protein
MKTQHESVETAVGSRTSNGGNVWISAAIFAVCIAFYVAEQHGYRIFDDNVRDMRSVETVVPSPLEILALLGITSVGVFAGLVSLIACVTRIVRFIQQVRHECRAANENVADDTAPCGAQRIAS